MSGDYLPGSISAKGPQTKISLTETDSLKSYSRPDDITEQAALYVAESILSDEDVVEESEEVRWLRHERLAHRALHWAKRPSLLMAVCMMFLFGFAMGSAMLAEIDLFLTLICNSQVDNLDSAHCDKVQAQVDFSKMSQFTNLVGGTISILTASKVGQLSDIYGRKPVLLLILIAKLVSYLLELYLLGPYGPKYRLSYFVLCACINPLVGGERSFVTVFMSYVIDVVEDNQRIFSLGVMTASMAIGTSLGPMFSSLMLRTTYTTPIGILYTVFGLSVLMLLLVFFVVPESRSERSKRNSLFESESQQELRRALIRDIEGNHVWIHELKHSIKSFIAPFKLFLLPTTNEDGSSNIKRRNSLLTLLVTNILWNFATDLVMSTTALYVMFKFDWGAEGLGYYVSIVGASRLCVLLLLSPMLLRYMKQHFKTQKHLLDAVDLSMMKFSYLFQLAAVIGMMVADTPGQFMLTGPIEAVSSLFTPAITAATVKYAPPQSVGAMMGANASIGNLILVAGPTVFFQIYSATVSFLPKAYLYIITGLLLVTGGFLFSLSGKSDLDSFMDIQA